MFGFPNPSYISGISYSLKDLKMDISESKNAAYIVGIGVSTPLKNTIPLFLAKPPLNQQTVQAPPPF